MLKPFSQACENNKTHIIEHLKALFSRCNSVLEIGSGTGQHAVYFAQHLPNINWHTSDLVNNHAGINMYVDEYKLINLHKPLAFDIENDKWPITVDAVFTANTTHIMSREVAHKMMTLVANHLPIGGLFCQYGPFNYQGKYTSDSNHRFDLWLLERGHGGIRNIEELQRWVEEKGLHLEEKILMPANNFILVWRKHQHCSN